MCQFTTLDAVTSNHKFHPNRVCTAPALLWEGCVPHLRGVCPLFLCFASLNLLVPFQEESNELDQLPIISVKTAVTYLCFQCCTTHFRCGMAKTSRKCCSCKVEDSVKRQTTSQPSLPLWGKGSEDHRSSLASLVSFACRALGLLLSTTFLKLKTWGTYLVMLLVSQAGNKQRADSFHSHRQPLVTVLAGKRRTSFASPAFLHSSHLSPLSVLDLSWHWYCMADLKVQLLHTVILELRKIKEKFVLPVVTCLPEGF